MTGWAIADIHGCRATFQRLLDIINLTTPDRLIFLGDLIDRGPVGLTRRKEHVTCRSCIRQGGDKAARCLDKGPARKPENLSAIQVWWEGNKLVTTAKLPSANRWHGRPRYVYLAEKAKWRKVFAQAVLVWGRAEGKWELIITRFVPYRHHLIKDRDNLVAAGKALKDVLVEIGVLRVDTDEDVAFDIQQELGVARVEVVVI